MTSIFLKIAQPLKLARAEYNLSQEELASIAGISNITLSRIESGLVKPHDSTKDKIEQVVGMIDWEKTFSDGLIHKKNHNQAVML